MISLKGAYNFIFMFPFQELDFWVSKQCLLLNEKNILMRETANLNLLDPNRYILFFHLVANPKKKFSYLHSV